MPADTLLSFLLLSQFGLPGWMFRHQLQHATNAQFPRSPVIKADSTEELLVPGDLRKPLSTLYGALLYRPPQDGETVGVLEGGYSISR